VADAASGARDEEGRVGAPTPLLLAASVAAAVVEFEMLFGSAYIAKPRNDDAAAVDVPEAGG
jgi:hypothetical protein